MMDPQPSANPKFESGQQINDEGSINLGRMDEEATLKCIKIIIKHSQNYESVSCDSLVPLNVLPCINYKFHFMSCLLFLIRRIIICM